MNPSDNSQPSALSQFQHQFHPVGRVADIFSRTQGHAQQQQQHLDPTRYPPEQSGGQPHATQDATDDKKTAAMSSSRSPQLQGETTGGGSGSYPEGRTSFQSSSPRTVLPTHSQPEASSRNHNVDTSRHQSTSEGTTMDLSLKDSISDELSQHLGGEKGINPLASSTPVAAVDGRNVSLTKMLLSRKEFSSFPESDSESKASVQDSLSQWDRTLPPRISPSKENLRSVRTDGTIPVEKQDSVSNFDLPPRGLKPVSSTQVIEKYSAPGALSDVVYAREVPSSASTRSLKGPEMTISEFGMKRAHGSAVPDISNEAEADQSDKSVSGSEDCVVKLHRLDSEFKIRTIYDDCDVQDNLAVADSDESFYTCYGSEVDFDGVQKRSDVDVLQVQSYQQSDNNKPENGPKAQGVQKVTNSLARGSSISEFKTAAALLHEKQRRQIELKLTANVGTRENHGETGPRSDKTEQKEKTGFGSLESNVFSHFSGENYTTPLGHLQKHVNRLKSATDNMNKRRKDFGSSICRDNATRENQRGLGDNVTNSAIDKSEGNENSKGAESDLTQKGLSQEKNVGNSQGLGTLSYTTPSKLLEKCQDRENSKGNNQGYGTMSYTTPSKMFEKGNAQEETKAKNQSNDTMTYTTPSKLLEKHQDRENSKSNNEGYGTLSYTTPSKMFEKGQDREKGMANNQGLGTLSYTTPSKMFAKRQDRENSKGNNQGYRTLSYTTPSKMLERCQNQEKGNASTQSCETSEYQTTQHQPSERSVGPDDRELLEQSKQGENRALNPAISDVTTYYFRRLSEILKSDSGSSPFWSDPELHKGGGPSDSTVTFQRNPLPSDPLSMCNCLSSSDSHVWNCPSLRKRSTYAMSRNTSRDTGFETCADSFSSLGYPDSFTTFNDSRLRLTPNPSYDVLSNDGDTETDTNQPSTSQGPQSALSTNEMFWNLYNSNPGLAYQVLGPEFANAMKALNRLHHGSSSSVDTAASLPNVPDSVNPLLSPPPPPHTQSPSVEAPRQHSSFSKDECVDSDDDWSRSEGQLRTTSSMATGARAASPDIRNFMVEKEKLESQMRRLTVENSNLLAENKMYKDKFNRATARVGELEERLSEAQDEMEALHATMSAEISTMCDKVQLETRTDMEQLKARVVSLTHQNESLQSDLDHMGKQFETAEHQLEVVRLSAERSQAVDAYKSEIHSLRTELGEVKTLLRESEVQVGVEMERAREAQRQVLQLTEVRNLLQQQVQAGGVGASVSNKQVQALEQRLRVTEERLHQERADRANNLSTVEEKLLAENARLQGTEKELARKLQREKDKVLNLDQRCRQLKVDNENLRLSLPLDESTLIKDNNLDNKSTKRHETKQVSDMKFILSELERHTGLGADQEQEMILHLWNTSTALQHRLRTWEMSLQDLELLHEQDLDQGLQNLREMKIEYDMKMKEVEDKIDDIRSEKIGFENTYKDQLSSLVKEKHDAMARLQTLEDMMDALRSENETLRLGLTSAEPGANMEKLTAEHEAHIESLTHEIKGLEGETTRLRRDTRRMEGELETLRTQLQARESQLVETQSELELVRARPRGEGEEGDSRRARQVEQLTAQVSSLQEEVRSLSESQGKLRSEKSRLERQLEDFTHQLALSKSLGKGNKTGAANDAKVTLLESELAQKDGEVVRLSSQYKEAESQLQHTRQDLFFHQQHIADVQAQVESLEQQLGQRAQLLETVSSKERDQLQQFQLVKDSLDSATNSLNQRNAQIRVQEAELARERSRREALERQVKGEQQSVRDPDADTVALEGSPLEIRLKELEAQTDRLRGQLVESAGVLQGREEEMSGVRTELAHARDELDREKSLSCQLAAEKLDLQQQLQAVCEDRGSLQEEKDQAEEDLVKLESKLQEVVHKFQTDASRSHAGFNTTYTEPESSEGKQMLSELKSLRLLLDGKEKEADALNNRLSRQQMETGFLHRRAELLRQENQYNKEDIQRLSQQLIVKMKENAVTCDLNVHLVREKTSLQQESLKLGRDLEREKDYIQRRKAEVSEVIKKMEKSETSKRSTALELHQREGDIASLETDLRQAQKERAYAETENQQLRLKLERAREEVVSLTSINSTLESRLDMERSSLVSEKNSHSEKKEELRSTQQKLDTLQREQSLLLNNLDMERNNLKQLRGELSSTENTEASLREQLNSLQVSLDSQRGQCLALRANLEQANKEKTAVFHDYQDVCRQLGEKEKMVNDLSEKHERQVDSVRREAVLQRSGLDQEKHAVDRELGTAKEEVNELNEVIRQKDLQLKAFGRTLTELEDAIREKKSLEMKLEKLESTVTESKLLLDSSRAEILTLKSTNSTLQENLSTVQMNYLSAQEQLRTQTDSSSGQVMHLKLQLDDLRNQQDGERAHLREALNQSEAKLRSVELNLQTVSEARDQAVKEARSLEKSVEEVRGQLSEEVIARKLLEQRTQSDQNHLDNMRKKKETLEERLAEMQANVVTRDSELRMERERVMTLTGQVQDLEAITHANKTTARAKQEQVEILQSEVGKLQQLLENQKQQLGGKFRKANLELKQQLESCETERKRLSQEAQQLSVGLEQTREQVAIKNKENLKLQEDILQLEDSVRDNSSQLKQAQESLKIEEQLQADLNTRFSAQEEELKRLRAFLTKRAEESKDGETKNMWHEMNRMLQGLSREMHEHMEGQQMTNKEARDRELKLANSYKKQINKLDAELSTERALHQITKTSVKALEEDNAGLRQQLLLLRRKSQSPDKRQKNRSEEINELIARSQSRANAVLSSGSYLDGTFRNLNPTRDYNTNSLNASLGMLDRSQSPDTASQMSDISMGSTSPMYLAFLNSSGNFNGGGSGNVTPRKTPQ